MSRFVRVKCFDLRDFSTSLGTQKIVCYLKSTINILKGKINLQKPASSFVNSCVPPLLPVPLMALNTRRPTRSSDPAPPRFSKGDAVATPYSAGDVVATRYSAGDVMKPCYSAGDVVRPRLSKGAYEDPKAQQKFKFGNPSISNKAIYTEVSG